MSKIKLNRFQYDTIPKLCERRWKQFDLQAFIHLISLHYKKIARYWDWKSLQIKRRCYARANGEASPKISLQMTMCLLFFFYFHLYLDLFSFIYV